MPRLFHRPPKYRLHKGSSQAIVSIHGKRIYLGAYGTAKSHKRYRELLGSLGIRQSRVGPVHRQHAERFLPDRGCINRRQLGYSGISENRHQIDGAISHPSWFELKFGLVLRTNRPVAEVRTEDIAIYASNCYRKLRLVCPAECS